MKCNEILDSLIFDPDAGSLLFKDVRYMLIRPETLWATRKRLEERLGTEGIFEEGVSVEENFCLAKGDPFCRFEGAVTNSGEKGFSPSPLHRATP